MVKRGRPEGSKNGVRVRAPNPIIEINKHAYINNIDLFARCIAPKSQFDMQKVLQAVIDGKVKYGCTIYNDLNITQAQYQRMLFRLRELGIIAEEL